jgi:outer membrane beta-barrel protein
MILKRLEIFTFFCTLLIAASSAFAQSDAELESLLLDSNKNSNAPQSTAPESSAPPGSLRSESAPNPEPEAVQATSDSAPEEDRKDIQQELDELEKSAKGPREVPQSHILVVQNRFIRKEGRHEVTPFFTGIQAADSFRRQIIWGASYTYHVSEMFGLEFPNVSFAKNFKTGLGDTIKDKFKLFVDRREPVYTFGASILFTPFPAKAATRESLNYFEGYFVLGGGMTAFEHADAGMAMGGLGFRAYVTRSTILKAELRDFVDFVDGEARQRFNVLIGASILFGEGS